MLPTGTGRPAGTEATEQVVVTKVGGQQMGSNRPSWGSSQALTNCDRSWEDSGSDSASHVRLSIDPPPSVTVRRTSPSRLVGSDTEEDGGSTPPAPTTPRVSRASADRFVPLMDGDRWREVANGRESA
jgi:hypothetical protein